MQEYLDSNRSLWDEWAEVNAASATYDVAGFKAGRITLKPFEIEEVGDVTGKSLLHLQCHFGLDTLSWARRGAHVTGADFSAKGIEIASRLATELGIEASFVCSDLYELPRALAGVFDILYTSFGAIYWLPDIDRWAEVVAHFLKPSGTFYMAEFHPVVWTLEDIDATEPIVRYPYFDRVEPVATPVQGSYADRDAKVTSRMEFGWPHSLGGIVTALISHGLQIVFLHEFPFSVFQQLPFFEKSEDGYWRLPSSTEGELPLMFSLRAVKR